MFDKSSRYDDLPESVSVNAEGEHLRGKELRLTPRPRADFLHTVSAGDRLDLLAYKYYGDPTRWWQISDANPAPAFPTDALTERPAAAERILLRHPASEERLADLLRDVAGASAGPLFLAQPALSGTLEGEVRDLVAAGEVSSLEASAATPDAAAFLQSTIVVAYGGGGLSRDEAVRQIAAHGFRLIGTRAWTQDATAFESFTFDDREAKAAWRALVEELTNLPGVTSVKSSVMGARLEISYRASEVSGEAVAAVVGKGELQIVGRAPISARAGAKLAVPPNQLD